MTPLFVSQRQADSLSYFTAQYGHEGPVRLSIDPSNSAGLVIRAELLDGESVIVARLLHPHGSYTE